MDSEHLRTNLRILCSYVGSVAECSRRIGINRQQFSKYLNGYSQPSVQSLRKICDYFGVDVDEIYLDPDVFKSIISTNKKSLSSSSMFEDTPQGARYTKQLKGMMDNSIAGLERYLGDYYYYYITPSYKNSVSKGFARLSIKNGVGYSHFYEHAEPEQAMLNGAEIGKFVGLVFMLGERIQIIDYSVHCQRAISQTILYGATKGSIELLSGLTIGIQGRNSRIPFTSRVVFEKISSNASLREKLSGVKLLSMDDQQLPASILTRLTTSSSIDNPHIFTPAENY